MKVFAISDLHLSLSGEKSMDIFGKRWAGHFDKISADWRQKVSAEDVVLVAGDISWGMKYEESADDLAALAALPGKKVLIKGNHDFWHGSLSKTRQMLGENGYFVQNDSVRVGECTFAGTRGWPHPGDDDYSPQDAKIYAREQERLRLSLEHARRAGGEIVGLIHYPPFTGERKTTPFTQLFEEYGVKTVVFGHVHGEYTKSYPNGPLRIGMVDYYLTSCDHLDFKLKQIL